MNAITTPAWPPAWPLLEESLARRQPLKVRYHGHERILCPHALGWKNGRATVLSYQKAGSTSSGELPANNRQRWRSMFVDEIEAPELIDGSWETAPNASTNSTCIDEVAFTADMTTHSPNPGTSPPWPYATPSPETT